MNRLPNRVFLAPFRGSVVASRLINLYPERHLASVFLSVSYTAPQPDLSVEDIIEFAKKTYGHDLVSYWKFFASEDAPQLLAAHVRHRSVGIYWYTVSFTDFSCR
jgi:hypothetical protein